MGMRVGWGARIGIGGVTTVHRVTLRGSSATTPSLTPAQALVADLLAYSPSLLLLGDLGTLQGDGTACVAGDPLTAACATWQDQSGNGNDATQATVMQRPQLLATEVNGRSCLTFDGMDDRLSVRNNVTVTQFFTVMRAPNSTFSNYGQPVSRSINDGNYLDRLSIFIAGHTYIASCRNARRNGEMAPFDPSQNEYNLAPVNEWMNVSVLGTCPSPLLSTPLTIAAGDDNYPNGNYPTALAMAFLMAVPTDIDPAPVEALLANYYGIPVSA